MGDYSLYTFCISTAWLGVGDIYLHIADSFEICHCYPFTEFTPYSYNVSIVWTRIVITTLSPLCLPISSRWHFLKFLKNHHLLLFYLTTSYSLVKQVFQKMVAMAGLEPARISARLFENRMSAIPSHSHKFGSPGGDCTHDLTLIRSVL